MRLRFPKAARLREAAEFARLKKEGASFPGRYMVLSVLAAGVPEEPSRLGIITTRKLGGAVVRSTVRRRFRELFRHARPGLRPGFWLVLIARHTAAHAPFAALQGDWQRLARKSGILAPAPSAEPAA